MLDSILASGTDYFSIPPASAAVAGLGFDRYRSDAVLPRRDRQRAAADQGRPGTNSSEVEIVHTRNRIDNLGIRDSDGRNRGIGGREKVEIVESFLGITSPFISTEFQDAHHSREILLRNSSHAR